MTYNELKKIIKENKKFQQYIYVTNSFTSKYEMMSNTSISIYRNPFGKYIVTK